MPYLQDIEYDLNAHVFEDCRYIISSQHRLNGNPNKSIWTLTHAGEIDCFVFSYISKWFDNNVCWGLYVNGTDLQVVGRNFNNEDLKIAKFVDANNNKLWHGYPADYIRKSKDRPTTNTLKDWVSNGFITKAKMSKIRQGQSCNL
jgi:hypothetical protein